MPVIDLRNYLGAPAEPPVNPVFDRTRKLVRGSPYEQALAFEQQAADVRSGRGMAALQAMQNQQDQIAQQAQNIRLQQEAQIAAEQATQGLAGLDPMQPDYLGRRQQILQKSPAALLEPQFRNALNVYDNGYNNFAKQQQAVQAQTEAQRKKVNDLAIRAIEFGADPNEIAGYAEAGDMNRIAQAIGTVRPSGKTGVAGKNPAIGALKDNFDLLADERKQYIEDEQPVPPEIEAEYQATRKQLFDARRSIYQPQQAAQAPVVEEAVTTPVATEVAKPASAPPPVPLPAQIDAELAAVPVTEQAAFLEKRRKESAELEAINRDWTKAKSGIEEKLKTVFPDKPYEGTKTIPLEQLAQQIVRGQLIDDADSMPNIETGALPKIPVADKVLRDLGIDPGKDAFTETGSKRKKLFGLVGDQGVTNSELIRDWADKYLKQRNLLPMKVQENINISPEDAAAGANFLNKKLAAPK